MKTLCAREGDFIETLDDLIFDVKGLVHPSDRVIAYLRYYVDPLGERKRDGKKYAKVYSLSERDAIIRERYPQYIFFDQVFGEHMEGIPKEYIHKLYQPNAKVVELSSKSPLDEVEVNAIEFVKTIRDSSRIQFSKIGISGSILVDLHEANSDIDIIIYGRRNCMRVHEFLKTIMQRKTSSVSSYSPKDLMMLHRFRSKDTDLPLEDFIRMEQRKVSQGKFKGRDFFVRFLLDWNEVDEEYGDRFYVPSGYARIKAIVQDDSKSIFTPNLYAVSQVEVLAGKEVPSLGEIVSFRGRFCEQAKKGEEVVAQGKVEKVIDRGGIEYYRLILGAKPSDFMISKPV